MWSCPPARGIRIAARRQRPKTGVKGCKPSPPDEAEEGTMWEDGIFKGHDFIGKTRLAYTEGPTETEPKPVQ